MKREVDLIFSINFRFKLNINRIFAIVWHFCPNIRHAVKMWSTHLPSSMTCSFFLNKTLRFYVQLFEDKHKADTNAKNWADNCEIPELNFKIWNKNRLKNPIFNESDSTYQAQNLEINIFEQKHVESKYRIESNWIHKPECVKKIRIAFKKAFSIKIEIVGWKFQLETSKFRNATVSLNFPS